MPPQHRLLYEVLVAFVALERPLAAVLAPDVHLESFARLGLVRAALWEEIPS